MIEESSSDDGKIQKALKFLADEREHALSDGEKIGKYEIERILGCSGQATVILVRDPQLQRKVVLKIYHESLNEHHRHRMINEGRVLSQINDPHVVRCFGVEQFDDLLMLVLEFVEGPTLEQYLDDYSLSTNEKLELFCQIAEGVDATHRKGVLHLDLKPSNVVVSKNGNVKLIDFGLVRLDNEDSGIESSGTPAFMPPEIADSVNGKIGKQSDVFGLGGILYFMLLGRPPFDGETTQERREMAAKGIVPHSRSIDLGLSKQLASLCDHCLSKSPKDRPESIQQVLSTANSIRSKRSFISVAAVSGCLLLLMTLIVSYLLKPATQNELTNQSSSQPHAVLNDANNAPSPARGDYRSVLDKYVGARFQVWKALAGGDWEDAARKQATVVEFASNPMLEACLFKTETLIQETIESTISNFPNSKKDELASAFDTLLTAVMNYRNPDRTEAEFEVSEDANQTIHRILGDNNVVALHAEDFQTFVRRQFGKIETELDDATELAERAEEHLGPLSRLHLLTRERITQIYRGLNRLNDCETALESLYETTKNSIGLAQGFAGLSQRERSLLIVGYNPSKAKQLWNQSREIYQTQLGEAWSFDSSAYCHGCMLFLELKEFEECCEFGEKALQADDVGADLKAEIECLVPSRLAVAYAVLAKQETGTAKQLQLLEKSKSHFDDCYSRFESTFADKKSNRAEILRYLAYAKAEQGDLQKAIKLATESVNIFAQDDIAFNLNSIKVMCRLITYLVRVERNEEALKLANDLEQNLVLRNATTNLRRDLRRVIALAYFANNHQRKGTQLLNEAISFAKEQAQVDSLNKQIWLNELVKLKEIEAEYL